MLLPTFDPQRPVWPPILPPFAPENLYQLILPSPLATYCARDTTIITLFISSLLPIRPLLHQGRTTKPWPLWICPLDRHLTSWFTIHSNHAYHPQCFTTPGKDLTNLSHRGHIHWICTSPHDSPLKAIMSTNPRALWFDLLAHLLCLLTITTFLTLQTWITPNHSLAKPNQQYDCWLYLHCQSWRWVYYHCQTSPQAQQCKCCWLLVQMERSARVKLLKMDVFAGFYSVLLTKKLCLMLLSATEKTTDGNNTIVGTSSNSASISVFIKIKANIFAHITSMGSLPEGPDFLCTDFLALEEYFPEDCANTDSFKFVKLPTIFPLPYGTTAINSSLSDNRIIDALCHISKTMGPLWGKLLVAWSKPFADAVLNSPTATALLPPLKKTNIGPASHWSRVKVSPTMWKKTGLQSKP